MELSPFLFFFALLIFTLVKSEIFEQNFENEKIVRQIDIRGHVEVVTSTYTIKNIGDEPSKSYILAIPSRKVGILASIQAYDDKSIDNRFSKEEEAAQAKLTSEEIIVDGDEIPKDTKFFRVNLPELLKNNDETVSIHIVTVFIHALTPFPAEISQSETQYVLYHGDAYSYSFYKTLHQSSRFQLFSKKVLSYTKENAHLDEDKIEYGPFHNLEPLSSYPIKIHSENNSPFATIKTMIREIEISHWGNIAIEDKYLLAHDGAKLKGGFSRHEYQHTQSQDNPSFRGIMAHIPSTATDIYYRDEIGNISSSQLNFEDDHYALRIEPRFPLFGGWKIDFCLGYNLPASGFLSYKKNSMNSYVLNVPFNGPFPFAVNDNVEFRVIMPEGASNIKWSTEVDVDSEESDIRVTYLDTIGRPVLILKKAYLVNIPPLNFQVTYSFSQFAMLQEPILLIMAFLAFFVICMVYVRVDLSLTSKKKYYSRTNSRVINLFCENGEKMLAAYEASESTSGDNFLKVMQLKIPDIQRLNRSLAGKLDDTLNTIKKNKKNLSSSTVEKYHQLVKQLVKY